MQLDGLPARQQRLCSQLACTTGLEVVKLLNHSKANTAIVLCQRKTTNRKHATYPERVVVKAIPLDPSTASDRRSAWDELSLHEVVSCASSAASLPSTTFSSSSSSSCMAGEKRGENMKGEKEKEKGVRSGGGSGEGNRRSPYVVPLLEVVGVEGHLCLVMPYLEGGDLREYVANSPQGLSEEEARRFFRHMVKGLLHLKRHNIAHGDVSLENVLLSAPRPPSSPDNSTSSASTSSTSSCESIDTDNVDVCGDGVDTDTRANTRTCSRTHRRTRTPSKHTHSTSDNAHAHTVVRAHRRPRAVIIDFDSACVVKPPRGDIHDAHTHTPAYTYRGRLAYAPPEVVNTHTTERQSSCLSTCVEPPQAHAAWGGIDAYKVDVWALGACLFAMLTGRQLYTNPFVPSGSFAWLARGQLPDLLEHYRHTLGIHMSEHAEDLLTQLLHPDPHTRPSLEDVLAHPWLRATSCDDVDSDNAHADGCRSVCAGAGLCASMVMLMEKGKCGEAAVAKAAKSWVSTLAKPFR